MEEWPACKADFSSVAAENAIEEFKKMRTLSRRPYFQLMCGRNEEEGISEQTESHKSAALSKSLQRFCTNYEPDSFKVTMTASDRYLKVKGYTISVIRDR